MATGTVTGRNAKLYFATHAAGTPPTWSDMEAYNTHAVSDFSVSYDLGTVEQDLVGMPGNLVLPGSLSIDGSFTKCRFGASGNADVINNLVDPSGDNKYLAISGCVSNESGFSYLRWTFASCQVTNFDITVGNADTITEASIDFVVMNPYDCSANSNNYYVSC